jgi:hypothetical protein
VGYDFGNNLVNIVIEGDWPEVIEGMRIIYLWYEGYKSGMKFP